MKKKKKDANKEELNAIFKIHGMTTAGALRIRKKTRKIRKSHEKKRGH